MGLFYRADSSEPRIFSEISLQVRYLSGTGTDSVAKLSALGAHSPKPRDQERIGGQGVLAVDESVEDLVILRARQGESFAYRLFFGHGQLPPLAFEFQNAFFQVGQASHGFGIEAHSLIVAGHRL